MSEDDLDELLTAAQRLEELAYRNGRPADLVHLAGELWSVYRCYRDEVCP